MPLRLHPDEWVIIDGALDMARRRSFEPPYFARPDHLEMKVSNIAYSLYALLMGTSVEAVNAADPARLVLISRTITAVAGTLMIALAYLIGRRFSTVAGVIAALLFALFPPFVEHSRFATPDVPLSLALMAVVLSSLRYLESSSSRDVCLASAAVAFAISIKYPGALALLMVLVVVLFSVLRRRDWVRLMSHGGLAIIAVPAFLFLISPTLFTNLPAVLDAVTRESRETHLGADGLGFLGNMTFYASTFASGAGMVLIGASAWGFYECARKRNVHSIPLFLGSVYWVALSILPLHWERWGVPMYITPLLLAAVGFDLALAAVRKASASTGPDLPWRRAAVGALLAVSCANLLLGATTVVTRYLLPDTRVVGMREFAAVGIDRSNSVFEGYTPLQPDASKTVFDAFEVEGDRVSLRSDDPATHYVILSSSMYQRFQEDRRYVEEQEFYRRLERTWGPPRIYSPIEVGRSSVFEPLNMMRSLQYLREAATSPRALGGPTIKVYDVLTCGTR